ncbi:putative HECT-type ubiquitin ligase-interacting protein creD [Tolypocladium ophioglossoides CBS 100239]|uniref:Putative HECT-type ubiquitin ligase-interacting protein creD n=1 Tax=Tolypocladium ophioglossoides (strain CBS 100239) TaxID=1163406 RepID=A0A0L0N9B7_TOLOC|nr:putative HECT-type ubiquitin ligase-interacting protein creD [Tolypocladium ophioglossoides CBS 100239]
MPSFKPFSAVTGRNSYSLFDIRLDQDFIVFRGNDHESSGQLLKGVVVLCLSSSLRLEDVRLRLTGTLRLSWTDQRSSTPGVSGQKVDKTTTILDHRWAPFIGTHGKSVTLPAGNYEYPFEYTLPGDTPESVEGMPEASITYRLKATVGRGKLAYDLHAYKHLRIIRTLEPGALEFLHAMSVENIWPNKVDYSIVVPQKAVVFGGTINIEMRFTPLLKGLELGEITAKMLEIRDTWNEGSTGLSIREHRTEREVSTWRFEANREEHWHDMIEDTGQEGWALTKPLNLPKRLRQCIQDLNHHGIKVRHKIKLTVALKNPDGHISELRATLPVSIFISPNVPFDEHGNLVNQTPGAAATAQDVGAVAPPGYGEHVLDQLYEDVDTAGFQTPGIQSGVSSPFYAHSRAGSADNLAAMGHGAPIAPAALSSRLADVSLDPSRRNSSYTSMHSASGRMSPTSGPHGSAPRSEPQSTNLTRSNSEDEESGRNSVEHVDLDAAEFAELNRVPSYGTAVRTPARSRTQTASGPVPDYQTALSAPRTPPATDVTVEQLAPISEDVTGEGRAHGRVDRTHSNGSHVGLTLNLVRDQAV